MPEPVDARVALALAALGEVTDPADVGPLLDAEVVEPGVVDLRFACTLPGYAAWRWTVSTTDLPGTPPTVLEVELLPGDDALLAPPWVPWTERLAEWRRQHPDERHPGEDADADDADGDEDDLTADDPIDELDDAELVADAAPADDDDDDSDDDSDEDDSDEDDVYGDDDEEPEEPASAGR